MQNCMLQREGDDDVAMSVLLRLLADASPDPISGGAGWVGAGLLGLVLGWLLVIHLPAKDKQLKELLEAKDKQLQLLMEAKDGQMSGLLTRESAMLKSLTDQYKESLREITTHCEKEMDRVTQTWSRDIGQLTEAIQELSEMMSRNVSK